MVKNNSFAFVGLIVCGLILLSAQPTFAACTTPASPAGRIDYTSTAGEQVFKYCNGTDWVPWAGEPVTGAPAPSSGFNLDDLGDVSAASPTGGEVLLYSAGASGWVSGTASGGGGTPAGADGQIQYNNGGSAFGGDANLFWDDIAGRLGIKDGTPDAELDVVGDIHYTGVITDVSDIRLKENIHPLQSSLSRLTSLEGLSYEMKDDPENRPEFGFSAQQMQGIYPELVHQDQDEMRTLSVNYIGLIAPMIEAMKELKVENAALRGRLDALEQQNPTLIQEQ